MQLLLRYILDTCKFTLISILKTDGDNSSCEILKSYIRAKIHGDLAKSPYFYLNNFPFLQCLALAQVKRRTSKNL